MWFADIHSMCGCGVVASAQLNYVQIEIYSQKVVEEHKPDRIRPRSTALLTSVHPTKSQRAE
jgi:hypothetical protein